MQASVTLSRYTAYGKETHNNNINHKGCLFGKLHVNDITLLYFQAGDKITISAYFYPSLINM